MLGTALSPAADTRHRTNTANRDQPDGRLEFRLTVVPATDARHQLLADAQLHALRELTLLAGEVSR